MAAARALGRAGDTTALPALRRALGDADAGSRIEAAVALLRLAPGDAEGRALLERSAADPNPEVQRLARGAMERLSSP
jgi:HEAT repeat protein